MPARRFWSMERQITRLMAEADLRRITVQQASQSQDNHKSALEHLTRELGETCKVRHSVIVKGEPNRRSKLARLMG